MTLKILHTSKWVFWVVLGFGGIFSSLFTLGLSGFNKSAFELEIKTGIK